MLSPPLKLLLDRLDSPLGGLLVVSDGPALRALDFHDHAPRMHRLLGRHYGSYEITPGACAADVRQALLAYFAGDMASLDRLNVQTGGSAFQRRVWMALRLIPPGTTVSYGMLAARLGCPSASRAVGAANGANPVAIVVPCHRVVGANASLTGYGGGLERKQWLISHERHHVGEGRHVREGRMLGAGGKCGVTAASVCGNNRNAAGSILPTASSVAAERPAGAASSHLATTSSDA